MPAGGFASRSSRDLPLRAVGLAALGLAAAKLETKGPSLSIFPPCQRLFLYTCYLSEGTCFRTEKQRISQAKAVSNLRRKEL
jgi:hypothetical protein